MQRVDLVLGDVDLKVMPIQGRRRQRQGRGRRRWIALAFVRHAAGHADHDALVARVGEARIPQAEVVTDVRRELAAGGNRTQHGTEQVGDGLGEVQVGDGLDRRRADTLGEATALGLLEHAPRGDIGREHRRRRCRTDQVNLVGALTEHEPQCEFGSELREARCVPVAAAGVLVAAGLAEPAQHAVFPVVALGPVVGGPEGCPGAQHQLELAPGLLGGASERGGEGRQAAVGEVDLDVAIGIDRAASAADAEFRHAQAAVGGRQAGEPRQQFRFEQLLHEVGDARRADRHAEGLHVLSS